MNLFAPSSTSSMCCRQKDNAPIWTDMTTHETALSLNLMWFMYEFHWKRNDIEYSPISHAMFDVLMCECDYGFSCVFLQQYLSAEYALCIGLCVWCGDIEIYVCCSLFWRRCSNGLMVFAYQLDKSLAFGGPAMFNAESSMSIMLATHSSRRLMCIVIGTGGTMHITLEQPHWINKRNHEHGHVNTIHFHMNTLHKFIDELNVALTLPPEPYLDNMLPFVWHGLSIAQRFSTNSRISRCDRWLGDTFRNLVCSKGIARDSYFRMDSDWNLLSVFNEMN